MSEVFNPMTMAPSNDEEVRAAIDHCHSDRLTAGNVYGLYHCNRATGQSVADAYEKALKAYIKTADPECAARLWGGETG